ncbi:MAG: hypothetical protein WCK08_10275 [Betaproteobacteria bacterium]
MNVFAVNASGLAFAPASQPATMGVAEALVAIRSSPRSKISISDSSDNIERNFDALARIGGNITSVSLSDADGKVDISASQFKKNIKLIDKFSGSAIFAVNRATASYASTLQAHAKVDAFKIYDNSTEISAKLSTLNSASKLGQLTVSTPQTLISMTSGQLSDFSSLLEKIQGSPFALKINEATASQAVALKDDTRVRSIAVVDTAGAISDNLDELRELGSKLQQVKSSDSQVIELTADQLQRDALVIGKLYKGYELAVTQATLQQAAPLASNRKIVSVDVVDTAANISSNLATLAKLGSDLTSVHVTDIGNALSMSSSAFRSYSGVLSKIVEDDDYKVQINGASVFEAQTLSGTDRIDKINVTDTAAAISANLEALASNSKIDQISQLGKSRLITVAADKLSGNAALSKISGEYLLSVTGASVSQAKDLGDQARVAAISVSGEGGDIVSSLADLSSLGKKLSTIEVSNASTPLELSVATWSRHMGTLAKITGGYAINLNGVSADKAQAFSTDARVSTLSVTDSAASISARLDVLHQLGSKLTAIVQSDAGTALSVTGLQYATQTTTLNKLGNDATLAVRKASAAQATALAADTKVKDVSIEDSSRNIAARITDLQGAVTASQSQTWAIKTLGDLSPMALTADQYSSSADALGAIKGSLRLSVSGAKLDQINGIVSDARVTALGVADEAANLNGNLDKLAALGGRLSSVKQSNAGEMIALSAADWNTYKPVLDKWSGGARVSVSDVKASQAQRLTSDWRVQSIAVADTAAEIARNLDALQATSPLISGLNKTDSGPVSITMGQMSTHAGVLSKLDSGATLSVREATVTDAATLLGDSYSRVAAISVMDKGAQIAAQLQALAANEKLQSIQLSDVSSPINLSAAQFKDNAAVLDKIQGGYQLNISGAEVSDVTSLLANSRVRSMDVSDSASNLMEGLATLRGAAQRLSSVAIKDSPALTMSYAQWSANQAVLGKITQNHSITVTGVNASQAALVAASPRVSSMTVNDSGANLARNLDALQALGTKLTAINTSDSGDAPILNLSAEQVSQNAQALAKITDGRYRLGVSGASITDFASLINNSKLATISVADSSANIAQNLSALAGSSKLNAITQTGALEALSLTANNYSQYSSTLAKIQNSYTVSLSAVSVANASGLNADSKVIGFELSDSSSAISGALTSLAAMGKLESFNITQDNGPIKFTPAQLDSLDDTFNLLQSATGAPHRIEVTGMKVADIAAIAGREEVDLMSISDSSSAISEAYSDLAALADRIQTMTLSDSSQALTLTHHQLLTQAALLEKIDGNYAMVIEDVSAANASSVNSISGVAGLQVKDTASAISQEFDQLLALGDKVLEVEVSDANDIVISSAQADAGAALMDKIVGEHSITIT